MANKLLLHACCAPCAIYPLRELAKDYDLTIFFYDPNIHPRKEYIQRRDELKKFAQDIDVPFEEGEYDTDNWFDKTKGLEQEPERGRRCDVCFDIRLGKAAAKAKVEGYDFWATVLTISPHKDAEKINNIGQRLADQFEVPFLVNNWKKNEGFKISTQLSKEQNFYRQDYCGCIHSKNEREKIKEENEDRIV